MRHATLCKSCGQPIKAGRHKPNEYEHAEGCPVKEARDRYAIARRAQDQESMRLRAERLRSGGGTTRPRQG